MRKYLKQRRKELLSAGGANNIPERRRYNALLNEYKKNREQYIQGGMKKRKRSDDAEGSGEGSSWTSV